MHLGKRLHVALNTGVGMYHIHGTYPIPLPIQVVCMRIVAQDNIVKIG